MKTQPLVSGSLMALLLAGGATALAETKITANPSTDSIVARMTEARKENRAQLRAFQVTRTYRLFGKKKEQAQAEVTAYVDYKPPSGQAYTVRKSFGGSLGEIVVRKILDSEREVLLNQGQADVSKDNYAFRLMGADSMNGKPCYLLELRPLRKDPKLLNGRAWVDANNYLVMRIEGEPAKAPSWWIHDIHIVLDFGLVHGMWIQTGLQSTANVHLLGQHSIEGRDVEYRIGELQAAGPGAIDRLERDKP